MAIAVNLPADKLAKYLKVAYDQRTRAANKFSQDYGPNHVITQEVAAELSELNRAILEIAASDKKSK